MTGDRVNGITPDQHRVIGKLLGLHAPAEFDLVSHDHGAIEVVLWHPEADDAIEVVRVSPAGRIYRDDEVAA